MVGFAFDETMRGSFHLLVEPTRERAIAFTIRALVTRLRSFLRDKTARIEGTIDIEDLATARIESAKTSGKLATVLQIEQQPRHQPRHQLRRC